MFGSVSGPVRAQDQQPQQQPAAAPQPPAVSAPPAPTADPAPASPASVAPGEPRSGVPAADPLTELPAATPPATTAPATLPHDLSPWGMFMQADIIVKAVMIGLAFASLVTWTVWLGKGLELAGAKRKARSATRKLQRADSLAEATTAIEAGWTRSGPVADLVQAAARELRRSPDLSAEGVKERLAIALSRIEAGGGRNVARGTGLLATIGATAPFVGLFGTVWGIMNSFIGISQSKTTNLAVVAPGIAEALLATAIGLVAAIPAVIIYNVFARAIAGYRALLSDASGEILQHLSRDLERRERGNAGPQASASPDYYTAVRDRDAVDRPPRAALRSAE
ncbi:MULTISPECIES: tonB-system energizer ExbB [unclassified Bradyrhizobium]|uniref:tonB-system energizer ExbB n=1 Tax=unclassified Bradyrhizobium TaxID=2631580 RepID=UPI002FEFCE5B